MRLLTVVVLTVAVAVCGCKKKTPPTTTANNNQPANAVGAAPAGGNPVAAGGGNTNYQGGAGAVQNIRNAARRTDVMNDMNQLGVLIESEYSLNGRMPTADQIKTFLQKDSQKILGLITDGTIILTGTSNHSGMWAYEIDADTRGGVILVAGRAARATADEVKQHLGR